MFSQKLVQLFAKGKARAFSSLTSIHQSRLAAAAAAEAEESVSRLTDDAEPTHNHVKEYLQSALGLSDQQMCIIQKRRPSLVRASSIRRPQEAVELLQQYGVTKSQVIQLMLSNPSVFTLSVDKCLKPKLQVLQSLGFTGTALGALVSKGSRVLPSKDLDARVRRLESVFGSRQNLVKVASKFPNILSVSLDMVNERVEQMKRFGMDDDAILSALLRHPTVLGRCLDRFQAAMDYIKNVGVPVKSKAFSRYFPLVCRGSGRWEDREKVLGSRGFSQDEIKELIRKQSNLVALSCEALQEKLKFLIDCAGVSRCLIVSYPTLLTYSLEKRIKPRFLIFQRLSGTQPIVKLPKFPGFLAIGEKRFKEKYVKGHPDELELLRILGGDHEEDLRFQKLR